MSQLPAYSSADPSPNAGVGQSPFDRLRDYPWLPAAIVGVAAVVFAYLPNVLSLATIWENEPNYSHGFLVVPIAIVILWKRIADRPFAWSPPSVTWRTWTFLALMLAVRALSYERGMAWVENATLIPVTACVIYAVGGARLLSRAWPAVAFLVFMLPLPNSVNTLVSQPLQQVATKGSCFALQLMGMWVIPEGNVINLTTPHGPQPLEVALACNGLSMLMTLAATVTATVILLPMPLWKRIVVLLSALPIALLSNISRIVATGLCYYYVVDEHWRHRAHDWAGLMMMPLALILVGTEVWLLSWLFDESEAEAAARPIGPAVTQRPQ